MQTTQLREDKFLTISWEGSTRIIGIDWKEATSSMTYSPGTSSTRKQGEFGTSYRLVDGANAGNRAIGS